MQFDSMTFADLLQLKTEVESEIAKREQEEKSRARKQILELAKTFNLSVEEVLASKPAVARKPVEAKYRHPQNPELTWTGRGRKPAWVVDWLAQGKSLADITI